MTTYNNINFDNSADLRDALNSNLSALSYPFAVKHKTYGNGQLTFVKAPLTGSTLFATIDFPAFTKTMAVDVVLAGQMLEMPEALMEALVEAQTAFKTDFLLQEQAKREASRLAYEQAKQEAEDKKLAEKLEQTKTRMIRDFEKMASRTKTDGTNEFFYCLGWIAKNCGTFSAALPDYLLPYFQKQFGLTYTPRVVDSQKKGPAGWTSQWATSMSTTIKKKSLGKIPAYITQYLNPNKTAITNTPFIWDLVADYGFQFGKTQDIDKIRATIPASCIESFEKGYAE
jgi:hypothetical protein